MINSKYLRYILPVAVVPFVCFPETRMPVQVLDFRDTVLPGGNRISYLTGITASPHGIGLLVRSTANTHHLLITSLGGKVEAVTDLPDATNIGWIDTDTAGNIVVITGVRSTLADRVQRIERYNRGGIKLDERAVPVLVREAAVGPQGVVGATDSGRPFLTTNPSPSSLPINLGYPLVRTYSTGEVIAVDGITGDYFYLDRKLSKILISGKINSPDLAEPLSKISPKYRARMILIGDVVALSNGNFIANVGSGIQTSAGALLLEVDRQGQNVRTLRLALPSFPQLKNAHNPEGNIAPIYLKRTNERLVLGDHSGLVALYDFQ